MSRKIAIVGMACRLPDACCPGELWEMVLAKRRAFRRIPPQRLCAGDYFSPDRSCPDCTYVTQAAVLEGYEFDRLRFRISASSFRAAGLAHWLALDVASEALQDAGFPDGQGLPRNSTGVLLGNTLTDEFARAELMRLRWPYVRRIVEAVLRDGEQSSQQRQRFLNDFEGRYKAPFAPVEDESLAGGLSNTIAGRICNHFDLHGGGYTIDGACASSLLATSNGCAALLAGDLNVVLVGGVDLSLDPFELVGFAKIGALAPIAMRVYDRHSAGFWPGEGCGFVVLMRHEDAVAQGKRIYAHICGWGVSSDGSGGLTRPEVSGQLLAVRRAYHRAGFGVHTVTYFEGHGTGTPVGDTTELRALSQARREAIAQTGISSPPAVIGSVKANIGHAKAAAGVAGLIKATLALYKQVLPPTTGCEEPHQELTGDDPALQVLSRGLRWPADRPLRAGVSSAGFGGINAHLVVEGDTRQRSERLTMDETNLLRSAQDAELFLFSDAAREGLREQVEHILTYADRLSLAELGDLAGELQSRLKGEEARAAVVASTPSEFAERLELLASRLRAGQDFYLDLHADVFLGAGSAEPQIGLLFPGQASPVYLDSGALSLRFGVIQVLYGRAALPHAGDPTATEVVQPAIATSSMAGLLALDLLGITACVAVGHSVGELAALHWAGAFDEDTFLRIARARGDIMAEYANVDGAMAAIFAERREVETLLSGEPVVIAGFNAPALTVVSGARSAVSTVIQRARSQGLRAKLLPVSYGFHSPLMDPVAPAFAEKLSAEQFQPLQRKVFSTITGGPLNADDDIRALLIRQLTSPVCFTDALAAADARIDLWIETGSGQVLAGLAQKSTDTPVLALDADGPSLKGLLRAAGAAFALGSPVNHQALFDDRFTRPFDLNWSPRFFTNPCELAPESDSTDSFADMKAGTLSEVVTVPSEATSSAGNSPARKLAPLEVVRRLVAKRVELPLETIRDDHSLLGDLHLNSIVIGELVGEGARQLSLTPPRAPTEYAQATVAQLAQALEDLQQAGPVAPSPEDERPPEGIDAWIRSFRVEWIERSLPPDRKTAPPGTWQVIAPPGHPLAERLQERFRSSGHGSGVVVCLPQETDERCIRLLLQGAQTALHETEPSCFVLVQEDDAGTGFVKTFHLESLRVRTCVVNVPFDHAQADEWVAAEAAATVGFSEARYDGSGRRTIPILRPLPMDLPLEDLAIGSEDVLLVTGGGKGIAAECALELARKTGVRLLLMGRSDPNESQELRANLDRMAAASVQVRYLRADVTDRQAVRSAIERGEAELGPVTAILHGAGINVPQLITALDEQSIRDTLAPKVHGACNVLAAVDPDRLRLLVTFGSIISRVGLPGEADYALANEWLTRLTERFQAEHPACRCLAVEWSVWSGVGMGQRLGRVEALMSQGITPISPDQGVAILCQLISRPQPCTAVVVTGRFGAPPTIDLGQSDLPLYRFLTPPRVHYPGVELIIDLELSPETDPYLKDHILQGQQLFPMVMVLEAMAQVAMALLQTKKLPVVRDLDCSRAVVIPAQGTRTIRLAALVRNECTVEVALRSEETGFRVDHFHATCTFDTAAADAFARDTAPSKPIDAPKETEIDGPVLLDSQRDLYGSLLFHQGRFRRLRAYRTLRAAECLAEIAPDDGQDWFAPPLSGELALGDPAARDAAIHALQACIPHSRVLPIGAARIALSSVEAIGPLFVHARERRREDDLYIYDLELISEDGTVQETWEGLRLKKVGAIPSEGPWAVPLLGPYVERRLQELIPDAKVTVALQRDGEHPRDARSDSGIRQALGRPVAIHRRPDGKPEVSGRQKVSAAHAGDLTIAVCAPGPVGCDLEPVTSRPATIWRDLLGAEGMQLAEWIAQEQAEDTNWAATRVWGVLEGIKKAGFATESPLVWVSGHSDGWVVVQAGSLAAASCLIRVRGVAAPLVVAVVATPAIQASSSVDGYHHTHIVGFEETNLIGNVYYTNYLLWQGRCRETFLYEKIPEILEQIKGGLHLATTHCSCDYFTELKAFDEIDICMNLNRIHRERIDLDFEYWRTTGGQKELVARGRQQITCILPDGTRAVPDILHTALEPYATKPL